MSDKIKFMELDLDLSFEDDESKESYKEEDFSEFNDLKEVKCDEEKKEKRKYKKSEKNNNINISVIEEKIQNIEEKIQKIKLFDLNKFVHDMLNKYDLNKFNKNIIKKGKIKNFFYYRENINNTLEIVNDINKYQVSMLINRILRGKKEYNSLIFYYNSYIF